MPRSVTAPSAQESRSETAPDDETEPGRPTRRWSPRQLVSHTATWIALVDIAAIIFFGIQNSNFWSGASFINIGQSAAELVLLALASAYLLGAAEFDISLGANVILSSVVGGKVILAVSGTRAQVTAGEYPRLGMGIALGILACVATGVAVGLLNGFVVGVMKVNSLITTLATLGVAQGVADILTNGGNLDSIPSQLQTGFGIRTWLGIPLPVIVTVAALAILWFALAKTRFGLHTLALGSSRRAAHRAGLRVERQLLKLFVLAGGLAGVAGFIDLTRFATTNITGHQTDGLIALAGAVIGGTSLTGGRVSLIGAVIGALLPVILQSGLVVIGLPAYYQLVAVGVVLMVAVYIDQQRRGIRGDAS